MLRSYTSIANRGEIVLRHEIINQLGVGPNGVMYGSICNEENSLILSQIQPQYWSSALKVIVHTQSYRGSITEVAKGLYDLGLETVSSWLSLESFYGHLCYTAIVVPGSLDKMIACKDIQDSLSRSLNACLSDLAIFKNGDLEKIRITPLAILAAYSRTVNLGEVYQVEFKQHSLNLNSSKCISKNPNKENLWKQLLNACKITVASSCILTPDTEEALLRICPVSERAHLARITLGIEIQIEDANSYKYAGYWQKALEGVEENKNSIYVAHSLLVKRDESEKTEKAEFNFVVDRRESDDKKFTLKELEHRWKKKFEEKFAEFGKNHGSKVKTKTRITRPRGIGVPCFLATNAKPGSGEAAKAAIAICKTLEGSGYIPVNIDIASGSSGLQKQVLELINICRFMVVLHCPQQGREILEKDLQSGLSDWVQFEESAMSLHGGEIIRLRFENVRKPAYTPGLVEMEIPETGITSDLLQDLEKRIERWRASMNKKPIGKFFGSEDYSLLLERDLVKYYSG